VLASAATYASHRTLLGRDAGVTSIVVLLTLKTLEMRGRRDAFVIFFLGFFTLLSNFFFSQSLLTAFAMLVGLLGLDFEPAEQGKAPARDRLPVLAAAKAAAWETTATAYGILLGLKQLFAGQLKVRESLGGPVAILRMAAQQAERGWEELMGMMLQISLMLGIMNLLPIPMLDGGTFVFCVIEGIRGKPLRLKTQVVMQNIGLTLLLSLFAFTMVNDLLRWAGH
jgi:RIP metalloprotease RseP